MASTTSLLPYLAAQVRDPYSSGSGINREQSTLLPSSRLGHLALSEPVRSIDSLAARFPLTGSTGGLQLPSFLGIQSNSPISGISSQSISGALPGFASSHLPGSISGPDAGTDSSLANSSYAQLILQEHARQSQEAARALLEGTGRASARGPFPGSGQFGGQSGGMMDPYGKRGP